MGERSGTHTSLGRDGVDGLDGVVVALRPRAAEVVAGSPAIPVQRSAPGSVGRLSEDALDRLAALDTPAPFFAGVAHALWMSMLLTALLVGALATTGILG